MQYESRTFTVDGTPTPKARPRFTRAGHTYTPERTRTAENTVLAAYLEQTGTAKPLEGPLSVSIEAVYPLPASASKQEREKRAGQPATKRPDLDNLAKLITDALNGTAYADDSQITRLSASKRYADTGEQPHTRVRIETDTTGEHHTLTAETIQHLRATG